MTACSLSNDRIFDRDSQTLLIEDLYYLKLKFSSLHFEIASQSTFLPFYFEYRNILNCICIFLHILYNSFSTFRTNVKNHNQIGLIFVKFRIGKLDDLPRDSMFGRTFYSKHKRAESRALEAFLGRRKVPKKKVFSLRRVSRGLQEDRWAAVTFKMRTDTHSTCLSTAWQSCQQCREPWNACKSILRIARSCAQVGVTFLLSWTCAFVTSTIIF